MSLEYFFTIGWKHLVDDISTTVDELKELGKEADTLITESKNELQELFTDGLFEIIIKDNPNYKTSYELRDEASATIFSAKKRFENRCDTFNKYIETVNEKINNLYVQKIELAKLLNKKINYNPSFPEYHVRISSPNFLYEESTIVKISDHIGGVAALINTKNRKDAARWYSEDAKDFSVEIDKKIAEINRTELFIKDVEKTLDEEKILLEMLKSNLDNIKEDKYQIISDKINILMTEYIFGENSRTNRKYLQALEELKQIQ